jgi:hypothetical protein
MGILARITRRTNELNPSDGIESQEIIHSGAYHLPRVFRVTPPGLDNECGAPLKNLVVEYNGIVEYEPPVVVSPVAQHCISFSCAYAHVMVHKLLLKLSYRVTGVSVSEMNERKRFYSFYCKDFPGFKHEVCVFSDEGPDHPVKERGYFF